MSRRDDDLRDQEPAPPARGRGKPEVVRKPETKTFIGTSEFWIMVAAVAAMLGAGYWLEDITKSASWHLVTWIAIAYIVSRGLAKAASQRDYDWRP
jgi:predicted membrane-bound dolichyl-phosphate-mannose-protein mannosyltransferase